MVSIIKSDYIDCKNFIEKFNSNIKVLENDIIFIINDEKQKKGYIIISKQNENFYIKLLYVLKEFRENYLGDGLLRTSLNFLLLHNIKIVKYYGICTYLQNKGFDIKKDYMICNIENFFCKNKCNEISHEG